MLILATAFSLILSIGVAIHPPAGPVDVELAASSVTRPVASINAKLATHESEHFIFQSDCASEKLKELMETAQSTHDDVIGFAERLSLRTRPAAKKMSVIYFDQWADYRNYAEASGVRVEQTAPGYYDERANRCIIFNFANADIIQRKKAELEHSAKPKIVTTSADSDRQQKRQDAIAAIRQQIATVESLINMTVVRHEIAHQVLTNLEIQPSSTSYPRWLKEGLAMQFEPESGVNTHRLQDFIAICKKEDTLPLRELILNPKCMGPGADDLAARYATAWALVEFLIAERPVSLAQYLNERANPVAGRTELEMFESAFGKIDHVMEQRLRKRAERLHRSAS